MPDSQRIYHLSVRFLSKLYFLGDVKETEKKVFALQPFLLNS